MKHLALGATRADVERGACQTVLATLTQARVLVGELAIRAYVATLATWAMQQVERVRALETEVGNTVAQLTYWIALLADA